MMAPSPLEVRMSAIPGIVTHNYDPLHGPFRNICTLSDAEAQHVLDTIALSGKRLIRENYLRRRRRTETWLLSERQRKMGAPVTEHPIYFFLGDRADGLDRSRPESIVLPLAALPADMLTFTFPDSMASLPLGLYDEHAADRRSYHGKVFTLDEIGQVIAEFGMPAAERWQPAQSVKFDRFIEVQLWDDEPLRALVEQRNPIRPAGWEASR
jgi:hypothetical protein